MTLFKELHYTDGESEYKEHEVDQMWKMKKIKITFNCPMCGVENTASKDAPLSRNMTYTCNSCIHNYPLYPRNNTGKEEVKNLTTEEKIELQLKSVKKVKPVIDKYPNITANVSSGLESVIFGGTAVVLASTLTIPIYFMADGLSLLGSVGLLILVLASSSGWITLIEYLTSIYYNYLIIKREVPELSYGEYLTYIGNVYQTKPFELFG